MAVERFNSEGYSDPTACEALAKIEREERVARRAAMKRIQSNPPTGGSEKERDNERQEKTGVDY